MALSQAQMQILRHLRDGPRQAREVASTLGIDVSAAYRQLETLREAGWTQAANTVHGPGRPKKVYRLSEHGWEAFPRDYAFLLGALMDQVRERDGPEGLQGLMEKIAEELTASIDPTESPDHRLNRLVALYDNLGFEASLRKDGSTLVLQQRNCPFLKTARDDPDTLCRCLDEGIIRNVLPEARVELETTLAKGDSRCRHQIRLP